MVGARGARALVGAFLVMMLASVANGFVTVSTAQTSSEGMVCGVDFAAMLRSAVNSAMHTLIELNISTDSAAWSLVMEANASVEAVAEAQAAGQCTTAMEIYLNATKKIAEAVSIAKREASQFAEAMEEQARLMTEVRAEIRAAIELRNEIRAAFEQGRINATLEAQLEARVNASIQAMIQLESRINESVQAGNLTADAIQEFRTELGQIRAEVKAVAEELHEAIAESYKAEIKAKVEEKLHEAVKEMQKLQQKLQERGICDDLPDVCLEINQSIERLMNLTMALNQSINANMSARAAMVAAAHAETAAKALIEAITNVSAEVNASIELYEAFTNASAKLDELKQAMIDLRNELASLYMPTQQIDLLIQEVDQIKDEVYATVRHSHRYYFNESLITYVLGFFDAVEQFMMQLNLTMGTNSEILELIENVITRLNEAEESVNATIDTSAQVSATFNESSKYRAEALLEKSVKVATSAKETLEALGMNVQASKVAQAISKLELAIQAVKRGDNATAVQEIEVAVSMLTDAKVQVEAEGSASIYISIVVRLSVSVVLAESAMAELQ